MSWHKFFLEMAVLTSTKSKDLSTKCGCVIVGKDNVVRSLGFNGIPRGMKETDDRNTRPQKYFYYEHAERNAIYNAARVGITLDACKIYVTGLPCCDCARAIIQSGIIEIIVPTVNNLDPRWKESNDRALEMFKETNVPVRYI